MDFFTENLTGLAMLGKTPKKIVYDKTKDVNTDGFTAYIGETKTTEAVEIDFSKNPHLLIRR